MGITEFTFNLLLIFFPGIICAYLVDLFTQHPQRTQFQFLINSFLLGISSYLVYAAVVAFFSETTTLAESNLIKVISGSKGDTISVAETIKVCVAAFGLAIVLIIFSTYKLHFKLFQILRITTKFGEPDVWAYFMNSKSNPWATVRDLENGLVYDGWIEAFSDTSKDAELLMRDVDVYDNDSDGYLYHVDAQYLSMDQSMISIEVRSDETGENHGQQ